MASPTSSGKPELPMKMRVFLRSQAVLLTGSDLGPRAGTGKFSIFGQLPWEIVVK